MQEPHFHFSEDLFNNCPDDVSLIGYYQSPKYFNHIADDIRYDFKFRHEYQKPCEEMMEELDNPVALHVRRGDFITNVENHFNQTMEYYDEAVKYFPDRQIVVFSDDPEWCKETFEGDEYLVSENENPYVDMCLMSMCSDFIIANSNFTKELAIRVGINKSKINIIFPGIQKPKIAIAGLNPHAGESQLFGDEEDKIRYLD